MKKQVSLLETIKDLEGVLQYVIKKGETVEMGTYHLYYDYVSGLLYIDNEQRSDHSLCLYSYKYRTLGSSKEIYQGMIDHVERYFSELKLPTYRNKIKLMIKVNEEYLNESAKSFISSIEDWNQVVENFVINNSEYEFENYLNEWTSELAWFNNKTELEQEGFLKGISYSKLLNIQDLPLSTVMRDYELLTLDSLTNAVLVKDFSYII